MNIPISKIYVDQEEEQAIIAVLRSGWVMQGPKVEKFEKKLASYIGTKYAIAVSSGTAALHISLLALGVGRDDEVLVPSFSFIATANCILYVGAKPVFTDIDPKTYNIDPSDIEKKITKRTKAILVVHQVGLPAELEPIRKICKKYNLLLVEDAACALGAEYKGRKVGSFGDLACFSFHPRKSITTGEGGVITTNNKLLYEKLKSLRSHGMIKKKSKEEFVYLGYNYRMTDLQAAIGLAQLEKLESILEKRIKIAQYYNKALTKFSYVDVPYVPSYMKHSYQSYMIKIRHPKISCGVIVNGLEKKGVATKKGIMLIHKEPLYKKLFGNIHLPLSERTAKESLILPLYPQMLRKDQGAIVSLIKQMLSS